MINVFCIKEMGIDFMGYELQKNEIHTFHHLIVPKKQGGRPRIKEVYTRRPKL